MKKILMHKDIEVAEFILSENQLQITDVKVKNELFFPRTSEDDTNSLRRWFIIRRASHSREDFKRILGFYGNSVLQSKTLRSLSDCYWIKDAESSVTWENISAFSLNVNNDEIFLNIIEPESVIGLGKDSPNLTLTDKPYLFWYRKDEDLGLICSNAQSDMTKYKESVDLGLNIFEEREYLIVLGHIFTFRKLNVSENLEIIPFEQLLIKKGIRESNPDKEKIKLCCETYGIKKWEDYINQVYQYNEKTRNKKIDITKLSVLRDATTSELCEFTKL